MSGEIYQWLRTKIVAASLKPYETPPLLFALQPPIPTRIPVLPLLFARRDRDVIQVGSVI
jgi:hypothetical protein